MDDIPDKSCSNSASYVHLTVTRSSIVTKAKMYFKFSIKHTMSKFHRQPKNVHNTNITQLACISRQVQCHGISKEAHYMIRYNTQIGC